MATDYGTATTVTVDLGAASAWGHPSWGTATTVLGSGGSTPTPTVPTVGQIWPRGNQIQR